MKSRTLSPVFATLSVLMFGALLQPTGALAAPPSNEELQSQVLQLQRQVQSLEQRTAATASPSRAVATPGPSIEAQLADLSAKVAAILQVLQISNQGVVLQSDRSLTLRAGDQLIAQGGQKATVESPGNVLIRSSAKAELNGAQVVLNNGSKPVAFLGGQTAGSATQHVISNGSPTVLVP